MRRTILHPLRTRLSAFKRAYLNSYARKSYSQEGEDMILRRIFERKKVGFYVDVGAHHPKRFSNTYIFYNRGWRGINIDAMPGSMRLFNKLRPRDINIECGVGETETCLDYYMFNEPALNGFSKPLSEQRETSHVRYHIVKSVPVQVRRLESILTERLPPEQEIDFFSVDVEGLDLQVLRSNNWEHYRPGYVLVEVLGSTLAGIEQNPISQFLAAQGYEIYAKCTQTVFFRRQR
jgi:FkbM family methyltransferase